MTPDAIVIFSAGVMPREGGGLRTTTYNESDEFGTLGGRDRVEAGALLAKQYPDALVVATCKRMDDSPPTLASTYSDELEALGVAPERIVREEVSVNTMTSVRETLKMAQEKRWRHLLFLSSEFQVPRIKAFYDEQKSAIPVTIVSSESVLTKHDPSFTASFEKVKQSPAYQTRLAAEARGIAAIKRGAYRPAPIEDKKERAT